MPPLGEENAVCFTNSFKVSSVLLSKFYYLSMCLLPLYVSHWPTHERGDLNSTHTDNPQCSRQSSVTVAWGVIDGQVCKKTNIDVIGREPAVMHARSQAHWNMTSAAAATIYKLVLFSVITFKLVFFFPVEWQNAKKCLLNTTNTKWKGSPPQPFSTSPSSGKCMQDLENDVILRPVRSLMGLKRITWPPSSVSLWFSSPSQRSPEKTITRMAEQKFPSLCMRVARW